VIGGPSQIVAALAGRATAGKDIISPRNNVLTRVGAGCIFVISVSDG